MRPGETLHSQGTAKCQPTGNDTDIVDQAGEGGNEKALFCKLHRHEQAACEKEKLSRQYDTGHFQDRPDLFGSVLPGAKR